MMKCKVCNENKDYLNSWQPFGPSDSTLCFSLAGSHYRGFPTIKCCDDCKKLLENGESVTFTYKGRIYVANDLTVKESPF